MEGTLFGKVYFSVSINTPVQRVLSRIHWENKYGGIMLKRFGGKVNHR